MESIIKRIKIYRDSEIEIDVICDKCSKSTTLTSLNAPYKNTNRNEFPFDGTVIDFSKLKKRYYCHGCECWVNYISTMGEKSISNNEMVNEIQKWDWIRKEVLRNKKSQL